MGLQIIVQWLWSLKVSCKLYKLTIDIIPELIVYIISTRNYDKYGGIAQLGEQQTEASEWYSEGPAFDPRCP
jgi:hypothetical protein